MIAESASKSAQIIPEHGHKNGISMRVVRIPVESVIALEKHVVRSDHVRGVEPDLNPARTVIDAAMVGKIVAENRACAAAAMRKLKC